MEHTIELKFGHKDKKGVLHKEVTFGRRLTVGDLIEIDSDPQSQSPTQHNDLIRRRAMTKFGKLRMPPATSVLLELNKIDRDDIALAYERFVAKGRGKLKGDVLPGNIVKLIFGFEIAGVRYHLAEMNRLTTGYDEVAADTLGVDGVARECFMLGRRISKLTNQDNPDLTIEGPIDLAAFQPLDGDDLHCLREGGRYAEAFFRITGGAVPEEGDGENGADPDEGNRNDGSGDPESPKETAE